MKLDWAPLEREFGEWQKVGLTLPFWWRDDDAIAVGPALDRLTEMAEAHAFAVHLAVIPNDATQGLADYVQRNTLLVPVVHGWAHINHAPPSEKKAEFGDHRPATEMLADAKRAMDRLTDLFGAQLVPMFVPPWNRISPLVVKGLGQIGYTHLSTFTPRTAGLAAPRLAQINSHLDPIDWKGGRGLVQPQRLITKLVRQLTDRREGRTDNDEPYGILTHHLVHDDDIWAFTDTLLGRLMAGPVHTWDAKYPTTKEIQT